MLCGNGVLVKGRQAWSAPVDEIVGRYFEHLPRVPRFLGRFFSLTRAASILLSRPQFSQLPRAGPVKAGRKSLEEAKQQFKLRYEEMKAAGVRFPDD
jgi:hypothetical protein